MPITPTQLPAQLRQALRSWYVLCGDEPLLQQEAADAIRSAARAQGYTERSVFQVAGAHFDWSAVLAASASLSLFADKQLLELRLPSGKPGKEGAAALMALAALAPAWDSTLLVLSLPRLDATAQKSAWFTAVAQAGVVVKIDPVERAALPQWMAQRLQRQGQSVPAGASGQQTLSLLADRVEGNLLAAHQEIEKLALLYPPGTLRPEDIEQAVLHVARYDPFQCAAALLDGQVARVQTMLDGLEAEGEAAVWVHWVLTEELRSLHRVKQACLAGQPVPLALREQRIWGPKEKRFERLLPRLAPQQLAGWVQQAHAIDGVIKGLPHPEWPQDPWQALRHWALQVALVCRGTRA